MSRFEQIYQKFIDSLYDVPDSLLEEEKQTYISFIHQKNLCRSVCPYSIEDDILCETTYFQNWDVNDSCIEAVEDILDRIKRNFKNSNDINDLKLEVPIKDILNKIDYNGITNFKNFHKFLNLLKNNAIGNLIISIGESNEFGNQDSFYEPPVKFGYSPKNGMIVDSYYQYIEDLTKDCYTWHEKINKIMNDLFKLKNFGTLNISALAVNRDEENLKITLSHEISHFLKFLVRINGLNYRYGLNYSRSDLSYLNGQNYESKPDEWKELAATYIEELALIFEKLDIDHSYENSLKFIETFLNWTGIENTVDNPMMLKEMLHVLRNHFHSREMEKFFKTTYENSRNPNCIRNTWKVLMKWLKNEFKRRFKE